MATWPWKDAHLSRSSAGHSSNMPFPQNSVASGPGTGEMMPRVMLPPTSRPLHTHISTLCRVLVLKMLWAASVTVDGRCYSMLRGLVFRRCDSKMHEHGIQHWKCSDVPACPALHPEAAFTAKLMQDPNFSKAPREELRHTPWPVAKVQLHWHPQHRARDLLIVSWLNRNWKFLFRGKKCIWASASSEILLHVVRCSHFKNT